MNKADAADKEMIELVSLVIYHYENKISTQ
jgi:elongation factor Tu